MTGYEIIILIAGLVFVVASFFFGGKGAVAEPVDVNAEIKKIKEAVVLHENEVNGRVKNLVESECAAAVSDVQDKLSKISNDKIIAIDEYASQVLERIENNNQAVVFLYDMLQKKDDEMKSTMNKMEQTRRENKELFDRLEELKQAKARVSSRNAAKAGTRPVVPSGGMPGNNTAQNPAAAGMATQDESVPARKADAAAEKSPSAKQQKAKPMTGKQTAAMENGKQTVVRNEMPQGVLPLGHTQAEALTEAVAQQQEAENDGTLEEDLSALPEERRRALVLSMYKERKTVKEISKRLSMGQGEVKLIIDLYAGKSE